jgi:hypothetical protein
VRTPECVRESELLDSLTEGRWPETCDQELRAHVASCAICADIAAVALPLLSDRHAAVQTAEVPSSAIVWWRAQMRARQEAARVAARPISVVQGIAAVAAMVLAVALIMNFAPLVASALSLPEVPALPTLPSLSSLVPTTVLGLLIVGAIGIWLLLGPIAIYFAVSDE